MKKIVVTLMIALFAVAPAFCGKRKNLIKVKSGRSRNQFVDKTNKTKNRRPSLSDLFIIIADPRDNIIEGQGNNDEIIELFDVWLEEADRIGDMREIENEMGNLNLNDQRRSICPGAPKKVVLTTRRRALQPKQLRFD